MPEQLTDVRISKVYEGNSGTSKFEPFDPYTIYNFYVQGNDKKFGWFGGPKKITPVEGMQLAYMEYTTTQDGEYTNYKVSKLVVKEKDIPQPTDSSVQTKAQTETNNSDDKVSYWGRYMTDIAIAIVANGGNLETADLKTIGHRLGKASRVMMQESLKSSEEPKKAPPINDAPKPKPDITGTSEELYNKLRQFAARDNEKYFAVLGSHGAESAEQVIGLTKGRQDALLKELKEEIGFEK